jgi:uncharacterized membrane protein
MAASSTAFASFTRLTHGFIELVAMIYKWQMKAWNKISNIKIVSKNHAATIQDKAITTYNDSFLK